MVELFNHKLLKQNQQRFSRHFKDYNFLHHEIALRMIENLEIKGLTAQNALEISAKDDFIKKNLKMQIIDDKNLDFPQNSFDLIIDNLNLQFVNEIPQFLLKIHNILRQNGVFIASFFGEDNLISLKKAVFEAENEVFGQVSPRFAPLIDIKSAGMLLQKAGFKNPVANLEIVEVEYENTKKLLNDIKFMGFGNILHKKSQKFVNRKFFDEIYKNYVTIEGLQQGDRVKARFEIIIMIGQK